MAPAEECGVLRCLISLALAGVLAPSSIRDGYAAHYRPGLMTQVAQNRGMPVVDCMVASPFLPLGTWVIVESQKYGVRKVCRVTDVAHPRDRDNIIRRGIVIELDFQSATQVCRISFYGQEPPRACPVRVLPLRRQP